MRFGYNVNRDLTTLDYLLNEHPNREAIFGSNSNWELNLSDEGRDSLKNSQKPRPNSYIAR